METEIYADILFLVDFSMDVLTLYLTGRITGLKCKALRISLGAICGALVSTVITICMTPRLLTFIISLVLSPIMVIISFGKGKPATVLKRSVIQWCAGMILGGVMTALLSMGNGFIKISNDSKNIFSVTNVFPICLFAGIYFIDNLRNCTSKKTTDVKITLRDKEIKLYGLVDSGNLLTDPFTGKSVIVISHNRSSEIFTEEEKEFFLSDIVTTVPKTLEGTVKYIPASGLSGDILLKALSVDRVTVGNSEVNCVVAISTTLNASYECIVPSILLKGDK